MSTYMVAIVQDKRGGLRIHSGVLQHPTLRGQWTKEALTKESDKEQPIWLEDNQKSEVA